ncbi:hypothetical protein LINGRAHAP2_LOCUS17609 [Linum grandiflorum]
MRRYRHNYPDGRSGSVTGSSACPNELGDDRCKTCLRDARDMIMDKCGATVEANVIFVECSLWFKMIA